MSEERILESDVELVLNLDGKGFKPATASDFIKYIQTIKVWGFCEHKCDCTKIIHIWFTKKVDYGRLLECVTHELEHASGVTSEKRCCKTGGLAHYASIIIEDDLRYKR